MFLTRFAQHQFFFLDATELRSAIFGPLSAAHSRRDVLSHGLLNAMFLWASRDFMADGFSEEDLLARTITDIASDTMLIDSWQRTLQAIQAQVLLSLYHMDTGRFLEGRYHCAAVTSLAYSTNLHQLGHPSLTGPFPPDFLQHSLPVDADNAQSANLMGAFRSIVILNNYWVAATGAPSNVPSGTMIGAPWLTVGFTHPSQSATFDLQVPVSVLSSHPSSQCFGNDA